VNYRYAPLAGGEETKDRISPKGGIIWSPVDGLTLRAAYARGLTGVSIDQSFQLEPTQIAGFTQTYRSLIPEAVAGANAGERTETIAFSFEKSFRSGTYLGVSGEHLESKLSRDFGVYTLQFPSLQAAPTQALEDLHYKERSWAVTLDQLVGTEWAFGAHYRVTRSTLNNEFVTISQPVPAPTSFLEPSRTEATLHQVNLFANYNHPSGFFGRAQALWFSQSNKGYSPDQPGDDFWQFNFFAGYRFWRRQAELTIGLLNLTDQNYRLNPLNLATPLPRNRTFELSFRFSF